MKCFIGLGSNVGDGLQNIERAANALKLISVNNHLRRSCVYTTPALMPENAPIDWDRPYKNAVVEIDWLGNPSELLIALKKIEQEIGRLPQAKWAPRVIDLDILTFGDQVLQQEGLSIPHTEMWNRSFVLDPLKDLRSFDVIKGNLDTNRNLSNIAEPSTVIKARKILGHTPLIMGILNVTPDSFSDGGAYSKPEGFKTRIDNMFQQGVQIIDIGAESTRPGADTLTVDEEWFRLREPLEYIAELKKEKIFSPFICIDTRNVEVAKKSLLHGADSINDVGGLSDPSMLDLVKKSKCDYVLTHSLTVPADPRVTIPENVDVVVFLKKWLNNKLSQLDQSGVDLNKIIFDPGIGFGKTAVQSLQILKRLEELKDIPVRLLVGHSRKSFMKLWGLETTIDRDAATLELSIELARKGVDILRVHDYESHLVEFSKQINFQK